MGVKYQEISLVSQNRKQTPHFSVELKPEGFCDFLI